MSIKVSLQGIERVGAMFQRVGKNVPAAAEAAMFESAGKVMGEAQKTVPVKTGQLRSSAFIRKTKRNQSRSDVQMGYQAPYATDVHEREGGRGYHWFAKAVARGMKDFTSRLASHVRAAVRR